MFKTLAVSQAVLFLVNEQVTVFCMLFLLWPRESITYYWML